MLDWSGISGYFRQECAEWREMEIVNLMPMYITRKMSDVDDEGPFIHSISYVRGLHSSFMRNLNQRAEETYTKYLAMEKSSKIPEYNQYTTSYRTQKPQQLFPSRNFQRLESVIRSEIETAKLLKSHSVFGILIDGEPGLGKSSLGDYIATTHVVQKVYRADLSIQRFLNKPDVTAVFEDVFNDVPITCSSLFIIDEMDKYLDYTIKSSHDKLIEAAKQDEKLSIHEVISFEDHSRQKRTDFLYAVLSMLERSGINHPCIVVFCSNNFDTIFGDLDMTHFRSIQDRFAQFTFERMNRQDVSDYLEYHNLKFEDTRFHRPDLKTLVNKLNDDVSITARKLHQISKLASYNFERIIEDVNSVVPPSYDSMSLNTTYQKSRLSDDISRVIESYDEGVPAARPSVSKVIPTPKINKSDVVKSKVSVTVKPEAGVRPSVSRVIPIPKFNESEVVKSKVSATVKPEAGANAETEMITTVDAEVEPEADAEVGNEHDYFGDLPPELKPYKLKTNPAVGPEYYVVAYRCPTCHIGRIGGPGFCDCADCCDSYDGLDLVPGTVVITKCHQCLHSISNPQPTRFINSNVEDQASFVKCMKFLMETLNDCRGTLLRQEFVAIFFRYVGSTKILEIINQSGPYNGFRLTIIDKIFEFFKDNTGFVCANLDIFATVCTKLLPIPVK